MEKGYYRLKMIDNDGRFQYSPVNLVNFGKGSMTTIRPNLVSAGQPVTLYIGASARRGTYTATVFEASGQRVREFVGTTGSYQQIETYNLAKGVYVVKIVQESGTTTERFIVH
jgi:hypothetical protein